MAELRDGDRVEHVSGGVATVTRAESNDDGNPNCAMILFDLGPWPDPVTALKCNLKVIGHADKREWVIHKTRAPSPVGPVVALRSYDQPTARDAQRRAVLLKEMGRPVKGEK